MSKVPSKIRPFLDFWISDLLAILAVAPALLLPDALLALPAQLDDVCPLVGHDLRQLLHHHLHLLDHRGGGLLLLLPQPLQLLQLLCPPSLSVPEGFLSVGFFATKIRGTKR